MRYRDDQWVAAEVLWPYNTGAEVSRLTGIAYGALMQHALRKGWKAKGGRVRTDRLRRIQKLYERTTLPLRTIGKRFKVHHSRIPQLAKSYGWSERMPKARNLSRA